MTENASIRPDVVALLVDLDLDGDHPHDWHHQDGRPLTQDEIETAGDATRAELQASIDYLRRARDYSHDQAQLLERLEDLTRPYFENNPGCATFGEVKELLNAEDRAEYDQLVEQIAPDGIVPAPNGLIYTTARYVAANFGITVTDAFRREHDEDFDGPFQPVVRAMRLAGEYDKALDQVEATPVGTTFTVPRTVWLVDEYGCAAYVQTEKVAPAEHVNVILTTLAEAIALEQLAKETRQRAAALIVAFNDPDGMAEAFGNDEQ